MAISKLPSQFIMIKLAQLDVGICSCCRSHGYHLGQCRLAGKLPSEAENSGDESGSVSEQNLLQKDGDPSQDPEPTKEKQVGDLSDEDKKNPNLQFYSSRTIRSSGPNYWTCSPAPSSDADH
ncbi:hypothetical protein BASA60_008387 [Batrachochytrium salamandrivorans]|nr:hypothetical protein BASA60_008387 [Batrachochytrium salamandrivorans]